MVTKKCRYKKYSKYNLSGSGMPGKVRQVVSTALTPKHSTKKIAKRFLGAATIVYYPLKWTAKALAYAPKKGVKAAINVTKTGYLDQQTLKPITYKQQYGIKHDSQLRSAIEAIEKYDKAKENLKKKYGYKPTTVYNFKTNQFERQSMNIIDRYNYSKLLLSTPSDQLPHEIQNQPEYLKKARILIDFVNKKLDYVDYKSQKILDYIKSQKKNIYKAQYNSYGKRIEDISLTKEELENKNTSARDKIAHYIYSVRDDPGRTQTRGAQQSSFV